MLHRYWSLYSGSSWMSLYGGPWYLLWLHFLRHPPLGILVNGSCLTDLQT